MAKLKTACALALAIAGVFVLAEAGLLLREARHNVAALLGTANAAAEQLRQAGAEANQAAKDESAYFQKTSVEAYKTAAAARLVIVRTDHSLNDVLVPELATNLKDSDSVMRGAGEAMRQTASDMHGTILATQPTLDNLARASAAAATAMADPHIADTLANVDSTSKGLALASLNVADTTARTDAMAAMLEKRLEQLLKPATLAERFAERIIGLGATTYGVVK